MTRPPGLILVLALAAIALSPVGCLEETPPMPTAGETSSEPPPEEPLPEEPLRELMLVSPDGGEAWSEGEIHEITWKSMGPRGPSVRLELLQASQVCFTIADSTENDGSFEWTCAPGGSDSMGYIVRVEDLSTGIADEGNRPFAISILDLRCQLTITAPAGSRTNRNAGTWISGETLCIAWESMGNGCGDSVRIELLHDQVFCEMITESTENDGEFAWTVMACSDETNGYSLRVTDLASGACDETGGYSILSVELPSIEVISPNGGEEWVEGRPYTITWRSSGACGDSVRIELLQNGSVCALITGLAPNNARFDWIAQKCGSIEEGYAVRVTDLALAVTDESDGTFSVCDPCTLTVAFPNGGELWIEGTAYTILWDPSGACGDWVQIELLNDGAESELIATGVANNGAYTWTAHQLAGQMSGYRICVADPVGEALDCSDCVFSIHEACTLSPTAPRSGETWIEGQMYAIEWNTFGSCDGPVKIELQRHGVPCKTIADETPGDGSCTWVAEQCGNDMDSYQIRISHLGSGASGVSEGSFCIQRACGIRVLSPNGGEQWAEGSSCTINWSAFGACGDLVLIELLRDGVICQTIAAGAPNGASGGSYQWIPEKCGGHDHGYTIRVTNALTGASAVSYGPFSIPDPCSVTLLSPVGGEAWIAGQVYEVFWDASASCGSEVRIELLNGGSPCEVLTDCTPNDGSFAWTAATCAHACDGYKVAITDLTTAGADTSGGSFSIAPPVFLQFSFSDAGYAVATNNPDWVGQTHLMFEGGATPTFACPEWVDCNCGVLVLSGAGGTTFFPVQSAGSSCGTGLVIDPSCTSIEVSLTGESQTAHSEARLTVAIGSSGSCTRQLPITTLCQTANATFPAYCFSQGTTLEISTCFVTGSIQQPHCAIEEVTYTFSGWVLRGQ
ncbi:MAG: hypothetical protein KAY24_10795 [Candidatus Eisenbacteria sp.]|nr:hypothetical protein [Candidatus Eisenbacteria bacterium]